MSGAFSAKAVANHFLGLAAQRGIGIDPLKMQKLVYFAHGWHLALRDKALINDSVEAWEHGPVIPDLYHEFKRWGGGAIRVPATRFDPTVNALQAPSIDAECVWDSEGEAAKTIIGRVWDVYGKFSGLQLSSMTHQPDSPWATTRATAQGKRGVDIPDDLIKDYFRSQVRSSVAPAAEPAPTR